MLFHHLVAIANLFSLLSSFALAKQLAEEENNPPWARAQSGGRSTTTTSSSSRKRIDYHDRVLTPAGTLFTDNPAFFDFVTATGANIVCEDFSDSSVLANNQIPCSDAAQIDSTTAPNNCLGSVFPGFSLTASPAGDPLGIVGPGYSFSGDTTESNAVGPLNFFRDVVISFPNVPTNVVTMDLFVTEPAPGVINQVLIELYSFTGTMFASQMYTRGFVGISSSTQIAFIRIVSPEITLVENLCFGGFYGVTFYDNPATFDSMTPPGTNLVCEDFADSPVGVSNVITCDVATIDSTTTPNACLNSVIDGFSLSSSIPGNQIAIIGTDYSGGFGDVAASNAVGPSTFSDSLDITFTTPAPTQVVSLDLFVSTIVVPGRSYFVLQLFDENLNLFASQGLESNYVGLVSETPIGRIRIISSEGILNEKLCFDGLIAPSSQPSSIPSSSPSNQPSSTPSSSSKPSGVPSSVPSSLPSGVPSSPPSNQPSALPSLSIKPSLMPSSPPSSQPSAPPSSSIKPSLMPSSPPSSHPSAPPSSSIEPSGVPSDSTSSHPSSTPSSPPSSQPSTLPSSYPSNQPSSIPSASPSREASNSPSSEPTRLTCDLGPVCDYDFKRSDDGTSDGGGIEVEEKHFAVCELHGDKHYHQGCYPESLVKDVGPGQMIPGTKNRKIITCGCCPPKEDGTKIKGDTSVCNGALDCFAAGAVFTDAYKSTKKNSKKNGKGLNKLKFETCIDGNMFMEENFYEPDDDEVVSCGSCRTGDLIV